MTDQQRQDIINAIRDQTFELSKIFQQQKHYGFYQYCPKCDGEGYVPGPHYNGETLSVDRTCPVCNGAKVMVRPGVQK